jgi:cysteinyl-tRNA synthetase
MSKSLKNFVSIQDYLKKYTGRQFRIFCLLHGYGKPVDYSDEHMQHAVLPVEKRVDDFLALLHARMRHEADLSLAKRDVSSLKWGDAEKALQRDVLTCEHRVRESLASNIDTEDALTSVLDLVTRGHAYLQASSTPRTELLASLSRAVSRPLRVFGVLPQQGSEGDADESKEAELLDTLARFRQQVRKTAISSANVKKDVLSLCDQLRDKDLPPVGFRLEDDPKAGSLWKRIQ